MMIHNESESTDLTYWLSIDAAPKENTVTQGESLLTYVKDWTFGKKTEKNGYTFSFNSNVQLLPVSKNIIFARVKYFKNAPHFSIESYALNLYKHSNNGDSPTNLKVQETTLAGNPIPSDKLKWNTKENGEERPGTLFTLKNFKITYNQNPIGKQKIKSSGLIQHDL